MGGARVVILDIGPRQLIRIGGNSLPVGYRRALERYRYGAAAFKMDWALDGPVPWTAKACARAATVHLGGTLEEIAASEAAHAKGEVSDRPFVLFVQPTVFDPSRAPAGKHIAWAYCHVPNGCTLNLTTHIERQVERFAPGFRDRVLARSILTPADFERRNANLIGGDINGGMMDLRQVFARPVPSLNPYRTPLRGVYLCSASTPPGGGVHGMGGYHAAKAALARRRRREDAGHSRGRGPPHRYVLSPSRPLRPSPSASSASYLRLTFSILPPVPTIHPTLGLANATAQ